MTLRDIHARYQRGEKLVMVTCYDYASALLLDAVDVDMLLVGDSLANTMLGFDTTLPVTMDQMIHHASAVRRGATRAFVVVDMPFMSYQISPEDALASAGRILKETGCEAVKIEGGEAMAPTVRKLVCAGVPVMGHIGLTPQSVHAFGGYRTQGRDEEAARRLKADAEALADAGAFAVVLELIAPNVAAEITSSTDIPTVGIGSGPSCSGQVQVLHDMLGLFPDRRYRHAKRYAEIGEAVREAVGRYADDVRSERFPEAS
ncbi:MAG: 3-methyl-2-oxobutanoate hydroxymethyltransferase [Armatimonadetes bacterium]|nr:3-methyl-2-oxobutanoate hydroxymethyltransferase [Armatimonadota bacterium]